MRKINMKEKYISIAIDGPAAAGKSTIAKGVADILGFTYVDTGAMYRAYTYYVLQRQVNPQDEVAVSRLKDEVNIDLNADGTILLNGEDVTKAIRLSDINQNVSYIASYKEVRLHLVAEQQKLAENKSVVMDGRDIGTNVLPNADVKIFLVADVKTRAIRRHEENLQKGITSKLEQIEKELKRRDEID